MINEKVRRGFISLREVRERLRVSKVKMVHLVRESEVKLYDDPLDKRKKLIKRKDLTKLIAPKERAK
jgi:hypothetical protein